MTATLVSRYLIKLPPDGRGVRVLEEMRDYFTARPGQLDVVLEPLEVFSSTYGCKQDENRQDI